MIFYILGVLLVICLLWCIRVKYKNHTILKNASDVSYKAIEHRVKSGDIILFRANEFSYGSYFQTYYNVTPFTHVGIIYKHPKTNQVYVLETHPIGYNNICNVGKCELKDGINLYLLEDRINGYDGTLYIKFLPHKISEKSQQWFDGFVHHYNGKKPFPSNRKIVGNYVRRCLAHKLDEHELISSANCSELVSYILRNITQRNIGNVGCSNPAQLSQIGSSRIYHLI